MNAKVTATIAVAVVALMVFAAAGSTTYSWFSDSEEATINVSSAKVEMTPSFTYDVNDNLGFSTVDNAIVYFNNTEAVMNIENLATGNSINFLGSVNNESTIKTIFYIIVSITAQDDLEKGALNINGNLIPTMSKDSVKDYCVYYAYPEKEVDLDEISFFISAEDSFMQGDKFDIKITCEMYQYDAPITVPNMTFGLEDGIENVIDAYFFDPNVNKNIYVNITIPAGLSNQGSLIISPVYDDTYSDAVEFNLDFMNEDVDFGTDNVDIKIYTDYEVFSVIHDGNPVSNIDCELVGDTYCTSYSVNHFSKFVVCPAYAEANSSKYSTLAAAIDSNADSIKVLGNHVTDGRTIDRSLVIDFGGCVVTSSGGAGSSGTKTQCFQLLKNNNIEFKNGTIRASDESNASKMIIQNYSNLTLDGITLDGRDLSEGFYANTDNPMPYYTMSINCGNVAIKDSTIIAHKNTDGRTGYAFDVYDYTSAGYSLPTVTVDNNTDINGPVDVGAKVYYNETGETKYYALLNFSTFGTGGLSNAQVTLYDDAIVKSSVSLTNVSIDTDGTEKVTITAYGLPGNNSQWYFVCKDVSFKCIEFKISYTDLDNQNSIWRNRGINCTSGVVEVDSCSFVLGDYAGIAIEPNTGSLVCKDTTFEGNATRGCMGIYLRNGMPATITGCTFGKLTNAIVMETTYKTGWPNDVSIVGNTFNLNGIPSDDGQNADHNGRVTALAMYEGLTPENFTISGNTFNTFDDVPAALFSMVKYSAESIDCLDNVDEVREIIVDNSNTYGADAGYTYNGSGATVFKNMSENVKCNIKEHSHTSE